MAVNTSKEDIEKTTQPSETEPDMSATAKVLNTCELLSMIILATHPGDTAAITRVSKTWYNITIDSPLYTKQLMRSEFFRFNSLPPLVDTWNVITPPNVVVAMSMWGLIAVLRRGGRDTVMACRSYCAAQGTRIDSWAFHLPFFFTSSECIPGLLEEDHALLRGKWLEVLRSHDDRREPWFVEASGLRWRLSPGIWEVVPPLPEELAEGAWPAPSY